MFPLLKYMFTMRPHHVPLGAPSVLEKSFATQDLLSLIPHSAVTHVMIMGRKQIFRTRDVSPAMRALDSEETFRTVKQHEVGLPGVDLQQQECAHGDVVAPVLAANVGLRMKWRVQRI